MKRFALLLALLLLVTAGCRSNIPQETNGSVAPSESQTPSASTPSESQRPTADSTSAQILQSIWNRYPDGEKFSVYCGRVEQAVENGPGDLDVTDAEELTTRYLVPESALSQLENGASLSHLMNSNIFTAAVFQVKSDSKAFADAWRSAIRDTHWICGQPDRLIIAQINNTHILMAFGAQELMEGFETRLTAAYPDSKLLYRESIAA